MNQMTVLMRRTVHRQEYLFQSLTTLKLVIFLTAIFPILLNSVSLMSLFYCSEVSALYKGVHRVF
jgi:hypothetical protein